MIDMECGLENVTVTYIKKNWENLKQKYNVSYAHLQRWKAIRAWLMVLNESYFVNVL